MTHLPPSTRTDSPATKAGAFAGDLSFSALMTCLERQHELYRKLLALCGRTSEWIQAQRGGGIAGVDA